MRLKLVGIAFAAALCLFAARGAKAQPSCVSVGTIPDGTSGIPFYTVTNHCAYAVEGVFTTRFGGSYSFGPLAAGETSIVQSTATGVYHTYVCAFPKLPRIAISTNRWAIWGLPSYNSDSARVACQ
jgi:hypothetical protein